jgi:hypothetical protein
MQTLANVDAGVVEKRRFKIHRASFLAREVGRLHRTSNMQSFALITWAPAILSCRP